jgi:hypothetical protein
MSLRILSMLVCVIATPLAAAAQDAASPQTPQGPMTVERVSNQFVIIPEYKVTDIHGETGQIVGVSGGRVIDRVLLIGAGGYWMVDGSRGTDMGYGGVVVEWRQRTERLIGFSLRGLAGFGQATRSATVAVPVRTNARDGARDDDDVSGHIRFRQNFFIAEPEADLIVNIARRLQLHAGAGYRLTTADTRGGTSLDGATGTIAFQIGW